ncbi:hypothetical protein WA026_008551 [Henosepilachna vigintioctopunctata]|uniref:Histone RNA hairpin-binding protein RNA-binding domain-containing protein n=1 Tax=Henosepilachna vigintioctopunctata TaxID=420089 RepID=A0AAW1UJX4_9CUCU
MSAKKTRLSMNTLLKNARIFDEDSSEVPSFNKVTTNFEFNSENVKIEPDSEEQISAHHKYLTRQNAGIYNVDVKQESIVVKQEPKGLEMDEDTMFPSNIFDKINLKKETMEQYLSPVKLEMDDNTTSSMDSNSRKSAKRTVFPRESPYKTRQSPYKRPADLDLNQGSSLYNKDENYYKDRKRKRKAEDIETDPDIIKRRQKQIDYGKNTIGYDTYTRTVPRFKREATDPQTPNKYLKYSRRGFDGLIKQWRLKLHKYDPPETE